MKIRCEYCECFISDTDEKCPNCGAPNSKLMRSANGIPKTIPELEAFCRRHNMNLERMRFFIGKDVKEPRAFGIFREDDGDFIVYKNKSDGSRAVRYRGKDEAYAVNELYQKLGSERANRRSRESSRAVAPTINRQKPKSKPFKLIAIALLILILVSSCVRAINETPNEGYYNYNGSYYYNDYNSWYRYDDHAESWYPVDVDDSLTESYSDYWQSSDYDYDYDIPDFAASEYHGEASNSNSNNYSYSYNDNDSDSSSSSDWDSDWDDSDWDFDFDSWDSGDTDWDSDW